MGKEFVFDDGWRGADGEVGLSTWGSSRFGSGSIGVFSLVEVSKLSQ